MPPLKRLHCDDVEWTRRKAAIVDMYVFDRLSQKKIRDKLEEGGFRVTKSELEAQLRFWNVRKNASADVWRYTDHMLFKRDQQGKVSVVYYNGRKVLRDTLKKERSRYQPDTLTKYMTAASPKTPEGMELWIRTPTPAPVQLMWTHTRPWIRFQNKVFRSILDLTNRVIDDEPQRHGSQTRLDFSPLHRRFNGHPFRNASEFDVHIASMMPEKADNSIANSAQIIVTGATDQAFNEHIQLILYCLSNNMYKINCQDKSSWVAVVNLIERSGLTNHPLDLAQEKDLTVTSIAENLFRLCFDYRHFQGTSAGSASNSSVISWLLESGQDPDVKLVIADETLTPLQVATSNHDFKLAKKLLDAGADPDKSFYYGWTPLLALLQENLDAYLEMTPEQRDIFKHLVLRLLEAGASLNEGPSDKGPSALMWAVRLDIQIAEILIQHGAKVEYQKRVMSFHFNIPGSKLIREQNVVGFAMYNSDEEQAMRKIHYLVRHVQRSYPSTPVTDLLTADVVCLAAYFGFKEVIEYWCGSQNDTNTRRHGLFAALCASSFRGSRKTCELLLQCGAPVKSPGRLQAIPSPLHFAALKDHRPVIELLCEQGADSSAIFLTESIPRIERALASCLGAYDPGALCAGVMLAISSGSTTALEQLIANRPEAFHGHEQEGVALGLAAWYNRVDILDILLPKIQSSTTALVPASEYSARLPDKANIGANIAESFEWGIPFWHREPKLKRGVLRGSPLVFPIWSQESLDKLLENNFNPDRLTLSIVVCHGEVELLQRLAPRMWDDDRSLEMPGPLYWSLKGRNGKITEVLLKAGISPNEFNGLVTRGRSPLQIAVEDGNLEMIDLLLEYRADVNAPAAQDSGATALQLAAIQGRLGIARRLIDLGANVNAPRADKYGRTALEGAAEHGRLDTVHLLLDCGANVVGDGCLQYYKAIKFVQMEGHMAVVELLENHREWTSFDNDMWDLLIAFDKKRLEELGSLEELIDSSTNSGETEGPPSSDRDGDSPEVVVRLDDYSDYGNDSILGGSFAEERISPTQAAPGDGSLGQLKESSEAVLASTNYDNMVVEDHTASHTCDNTAWNQQFGHAENEVQTSWNFSPIEAVHGVHTMQGFRATDFNSQPELNQHFATANQDLQPTWETPPMEGVDYEVMMEDQLFLVMIVDSAWNQQFGTTDWNGPQS
ncbi:Ankyrin-1 [Colletotrichum fructicola]|nr:Ankyrin-1 [Colletotrichum fructicola]